MNEFDKSKHMAERHFRKDVGGFRQRRRLELEDLLKTEREKAEDLQDHEKIAWLQEELNRIEGEEHS